ncbi:SulP family inorganic anion transporter [Ideonella sp. A 288]|uniref:SulP family inorganic anion transporter n=1 Tax=Ideonella sp. A 288 TaxID=1962181 RepID=UPI001303548E|nr:SulP family inorganic anion transporter [Ideonella sp. A 288]
MSLPILRWRDEWRQPGAVRADLLAGLTGAIVVLPQGIAFATLAGMPAQYGLYAAMVPCMVAALFGSSRLMVTGPANAISLTTMAVVSPLAAVGSPHYVSLVLTLAFLVGLMQLLLGLARVGALVERVPHSVVVGFTAGAAVLIINSQLGPLLALPLPRNTSVLTNLTSAVERLPQVQPLALASGLATIVLAIVARPFNRIVPAMLVAVIGGTLVAKALAAAQPGWPPLATVQAVVAAWPPLSAPDLSVDTVRSLFGATLVMTLLALTEASAIARSMARLKGDTLDGNQEFIGQGLANLAGAFFSAFPASGSFNRSAVNLEAGARSPLAAASAAVLLLLLLIFVGPLARHLPLAVVAGLLFVVAWGLFDVREMRRIWRDEAHERAPMLVTLVATVTLSLEWAILLGITSALLVQRLVRGDRLS